MASNIVSPIVNALSTIKNICSNIAINIIDGIKNFFKDTVENIKNISNFISDFFNNLLDFLKNIFIPSEEQWQEVTNTQASIGDTIKTHLPFISLFNNEYKKAQESVSQTDFLVISIPEFNFSSGGIVAKSNSQKIINVRDAYEPYRSYIRNLLFFIVIACAFVFVIKHVLKFDSVFNVSNNDKGGSQN